MDESIRASGGADLRPVLLVDGARNAHGRVVSWTAEELVSELTTVRPVGSKVDAPGWLPVEMVDGSAHRKRDNVASVWALVCDIDDNLGDFGALVTSVRGLGIVAIMHTTWSHTPEHPKARVVFPMEYPCPVGEWGEVWSSGAAWATTWGAEVDQACKDPSRLYFLPAVDGAEWVTRSEWFDAEVLDGELLSWRWLVAHHLPPAPKVLPPPRPLTGAGKTYADLDREQRKRRAFALAVVRRRAELVGTAAPGKGNKGRNVYAYTGGRAVGQLVAAGVLDEGEGYDALVSAAVGAGLKQHEAARAVRNGIYRGKQEGAWDFSQSS